MSDCLLTDGSVSLLVKEELLHQEDWKDDWESCSLQPGAVLRIPLDPDEINRIVEEREAPLEEPQEPLDQEPTQPAPLLEEPVSEVEVEAPAATSPIEQPVEQPVEPPQELLAYEEVPSDPTGGLVGELNSLAETTGADPTLTIALAAIAVLGGGTAWKFYRQFSEQKHEQKMEQMKLEAKAKGMEGQSPGPCQTVHAQLKAEVEELRSKVDKVDRRTAVNADFDGDDADRRIRRLEKWRKALEEDEDDA
jgi:hypothetical protein